ncbi:hypothetical protein FRC01_002076 [Tulasnella sp. 417]|nr:hypothetical protein FRC01_002076 [Tulasnella sp. 417]
MACFVPAWTLTFKSATTAFESEELRIFGNVYAYMMGVVIEDGPQALNWPLAKCYRFGYPKISTSIIVASFLYDRMVWKMRKDHKKTRTIEAFYRESAFYIGIKCVMCSHIILRLRSYFAEGDSIIDGHLQTDHFADEGKVRGHENSSSKVSTIIQFAHMLSGSSCHVVEVRSRGIGWGTRPTSPSESQPEDRAVNGEGPATRSSLEPVSPHPLRSNAPQQRQKLDWFDTGSPLAERNLGGVEAPRNRSPGPNAAHSGSLRVQRQLTLQSPPYPNSSNSTEDLSTVVEMEDLTAVRESGRRKGPNAVSRDR